MQKYFILAQSKTTAHALSAWLEILGEPSLKNMEDARLILGTEYTSAGTGRIRICYDNLVGKFGALVFEHRGGDLCEIIVLVDSIKPSALNPLAEGEDWNTILAMLILTFPEIRWIFGVIAMDEGDKGFPVQEHSLLSLIFSPRRSFLFDPNGLRIFIRKNINKNEVISGGTVPVREMRAAAIDEEESYALFHAYTAYRFGYRADVVHSWALMGHLFGKAEESPHGFDLLLEDVNLNFPDKPGRYHLSSFNKYRHEVDGLTGRAKHCPQLSAEEESSDFRVIVTNGYSGADADKIAANRRFIESYKGKDNTGFVLKPVGGIFDLWEKTKLFKRLPRRREDSGGQVVQQGHPDGFVWPPPLTESAEKSGGHSAPGRIMLIAQHLVQRADALLKSTHSLEADIHGAVLATEALELLRYQTPTLALQALSLKQEFEVRAEVAFLGVGHHFELKRRFRELEQEVHAASRYFQKKGRHRAELDVLASIGNRLMLVFRAAGQFDEEMHCLVRVRAWHRQLRKRLVKPWQLPVQWLMSYTEWLLAAPKNFIGVLIIWYFVLVALYLPLVPVLPPENWPKGLPYNSLLIAFSDTWHAFSFGESNETIRTSWSGFGHQILSSVSGLFHFGVFISYLYSVVTRK